MNIDEALREIAKYQNIEFKEILNKYNTLNWNKKLYPWKK